ncbi:hypothetical protein NLO83_20705 [Pseudomonas tremae]|uniref:Restriction endonuclease n=1 Tax=Pseudomonas savastanoi TaxID=29438 RepID=A0A3M5G127_PSESS|nr:MULTISPECIES: hypothetical protein [Pseudomonas syringae group]KAA3535647.1 hypothetical protein DXU85_24200 [Pseudomonas savastanoi]KWS35845.1 hypothetical protein AL065_00860 [Pseudomonas amygdali pv. ulmi]MCQ3018004.1 hypothetical protein [Pseudomonas tremae]QGL58910.1 hypothetical protein POR16_22530 [Pseudomonas coronafaciens pv. oryzae str. 1_6]QQN27848.1 hypothetical protein JHZ65_02230 [Pseudomonas syringae pv. maculicola]
MGDMSGSTFDNLTIGQLKLFAEELGLSGITGSIRRATASTYDQFVDTLHSDLDDVIKRIQENPEVRAKDGEDRLTMEIVNILRAMGYNAAHETKIGGHTDLSVKGKNNYLWIGEAKIHGAYDYLFQGFQQLCTRYATGDAQQNRGALIIYIKNANSAQVIRNWQERLVTYELEDLTILPCKDRPGLAFDSSHKLVRTGLAFGVKHIGVSLYFKPQDI